MSSHIGKKDPFEVLLEAYVEELMEMSDTEVLDGDDPTDLKALGSKMLDDAKAEAGRRRLTNAKARLASRKNAPVETTPAVSATVARDFLRKASNDSRFTLAARGLDEMSDEDALRLYYQIKRLEQTNDNSPGVDE